MLLSPDDAALFYRAWGALLTWVNDHRSIVPRFPRPTPGHPIDASLANQIASWKHRVTGKFVVLRHLQKHSIFMNEHVYGVLGSARPKARRKPGRRRDDR